MAKLNLNRYCSEMDISTYVGDRCWELLANEIIFQAAESYKTALRMAKMLDREEESAVELYRIAKAEYDSALKQAELARESNNRERVRMQRADEALKEAIKRHEDESILEKLRKVAADQKAKRTKSYEDVLIMNSTVTYLRKIVRLVDANDGHPPYLDKRIEECESFFKLINGSVLTKLDTEELMLRIFREVEDETYEQTMKELNKSDRGAEILVMSKPEKESKDEEDEEETDS